MRPDTEKLTFKPNPSIRKRLIRELIRLSEQEGATVFAARLINNALDKYLPPSPDEDQAIPISEEKPPKKPRLIQSA